MTLRALIYIFNVSIVSLVSIDALIQSEDAQEDFEKDYFIAATMTGYGWDMASCDW